MIEVYTDGVGEVVAKFDNLDARMTEELRKSISKLTIKLQGNVVKDKLSGQVLGRRTGRLARSIHHDVQAAGERVTGVVSTNVWYGIQWELGWPGAKSLHAAKGKFDLSASADAFKNGTPKQRAFLVPSLKEMAASGEIESEISAGIARATT